MSDQQKLLHNNTIIQKNYFALHKFTTKLFKLDLPNIHST